ncbi:MAG: hypothetical protein A2044_02665 [Candidatus Firestonebacteria bacterium GWA2_43_8]|nr:MAG: hypothetical protein A2044_02665 [Candidatus Firestonebacteria bacterium GWA2_43_8]
MKKKSKVIIIIAVVITIICVIGVMKLMKGYTLPERAGLVSGLSVPDNAKVIKHDEYWGLANGYFYLELQLEKKQLDEIVEEAKTKREYLPGDKIRLDDLLWYLQDKYDLPKDLSKVYYWYEKAKSSDPLRYTIVLIDIENNKLVVFVSDS